MLYDYLHEFAEIQQAGSLSAASKNLDVSQPTLSRHLAALEFQLGTKLVERTSAGLRITEDGRHVFELALDIGTLRDSVIRHYSDEGRRHSERKISVGVIGDPKASMQIIMRARDELNSLGGGITLQFLRPRYLCSIFKSLQQHDVDVVVDFVLDSLHASGEPGIFFKSLGSVAVDIAVSPGHWLAKKAQVRIDDLRDIRVVHDVGPSTGHTDERAFWTEFEHACAKAGFAPISRRRYRTSLETCYADEAVVCIADSDQASDLRQAGMNLIPVEGVSLDVRALTRSDDVLARELVERASVLSQTPEPPAVSHESAYGSIAKNGRGHPARRLTSAERAQLFERVADEPEVAEDLVLPNGTVIDKAYVALRNRLNRIGEGLSNDPVADSYEAIMHLWSVEDACAELAMPLLRWFNAYEYSCETGRDLDWCETTLEDMARRNLIVRAVRGGTAFYATSAWIYGIWEANVQHYTEESLRWGIYGSDAGTGSQYPVMHACPVSANVVSDHRILPYRDWRGYLRSQQIVCVAPCQCRKASDILHSSEDYAMPPKDQEDPMDVCLTVGEMAQFWIDNRNGRQVSVEKALEIADDAVFNHGLVPQMCFAKDPGVICFCRSSRCLVLGAVRAAGGHTGSMPNMSAYRLAFDADKCIKCGACAKRCPMGAITPDEEGLPLAGDTCVACGQCALACPKKARLLQAKDKEEICELPDDMVMANRWKAEDRMARGYIRDFTGTRLQSWQGVPQ